MKKLGLRDKEELAHDYTPRKYKSRFKVGSSGCRAPCSQTHRSSSWGLPSCPGKPNASATRESLGSCINVFLTTPTAPENKQTLKTEALGFFVSLFVFFSTHTRKSRHLLLYIFWTAKKRFIVWNLFQPFGEVLVKMGYACHSAMRHKCLTEGLPSHPLFPYGCFE